MPVIESVFPTSGSEGVPVGAQIIVVFDEEVDPTTINRSFIMTGPDSDRWTGPDLQLFDRPQTPTPEFFLDSPGYTGIVQGSFEVVKINNSGSSVSAPSYSYGGPVPYKSKVIFTPNDSLASSTEYEVIVSGDELDTDDIKVGIASRTVFDVQLGTNIGDGTCLVTGGYTGTIDDVLVVKISVQGDIGTAKYDWYLNSDPLTIRTGTTSSHEVFLENGLYISFGGTNFRVDDEFRITVRPPTYMSGSFTFSFKTGSGSIAAIPSVTSTTVLGDLVSTSSETQLMITGSKPADLSSFVSLDTDTIKIYFNNPLDETTITQDTVTVTVTPARGFFSGNQASNFGEIPKILSLSSDKKTLTIKI